MKHNCILLFLIVFFSGCTERTIPLSTDNSGDLPPVSRIISAAPSITEIIAGLGLAGKLIATDKYSRDIAGVRKDLPEVDFFYPDIEAIAGLKPDIIISGEINTAGNADAPYKFFEQLGITVVQIPTSNSIEEIYRDILTIAGALHVTEKGEELAGRMRLQIETIAARVQPDTNIAQRKKTVYFEITPAPYIVSFGKGTYLNELIEITGAQNIFAAEERWFTPGAEAIISANPDLIIILNGVSDIAEVKSRPGFRSITAVKQNSIFGIDANHASRPSQNIVLALEELYRAVYAH